MIGAWSISATELTDGTGVGSAFFVGSNATLTAPAGTGPFYLFLGDNDGRFDDNGEGYCVTVTPANEDPDCSNAVPSVATLWPPNHKFVPITITGVTDPDGDPVTITIDSIFQDEAVDAPGSGKTSPDGQGVGTATAEVRAERAGGGNGRVYHIRFTADDGKGGTCSGEVLVGVPHDKKDTAVDDGALFDSTAP